MTALVEFALFAWVAISIVAVLVQLVRIARYKRSARSTAKTRDLSADVADPPTIDLGQQPVATARATGNDTTEGDGGTPPGLDVSRPEVRGAAVASRSAAGGGTIVGGASPSAAGAAPLPSQPASHVPAVDDTTGLGRATDDAANPDVANPDVANPGAAGPRTGRATEPTPSATPAADPPPDPADSTADTTTDTTTDQASTLADLLAGVRLPWNLLPTVDHGREPSNQRVALITHQGEPGEIGADVADELERLGFTITPRGEDTAIATKGGRSLGLRIIPEPADAEIDGRRRFPGASETSVALDIWIE